ncbi:AMY-1-associating protein expressed in testis [Ooceraea biroi]|uniref:AMY-1-associating protein expressed in testis n=1 Tax=Ooceraea biroi TaxID=2015173 RepID=A0A026WN50_OOCBI|nr:AMY-1-associating protein expressed in testis [Ooceraea biroi]
MYKGRERCRELIEELQSTQALDRQKDRLCEILNSLEGGTVCGTLDFLSKELVRLEDERRAHASALLAERERCMREAAEAGRRQLERNRRREFDEMFKQIVKVNQDSVEAYLEDVINEGIDWMSDKAAKEHILELCDEMDAVSKDASEGTGESAEQELVADIIHNFVLPEVEKHDTRRKIRDREQSYTRNAHASIYEQILDLPSVESSQVTVQEVCIRNEDMQAISVNDTVRRIDNYYLLTSQIIFLCKSIYLFFSFRNKFPNRKKQNP